MTNENWVEQFNQTKETFQWFIDKYFPGLFPVIEVLVKNDHITNAKSLMNDVWFELPDSQFNIIENPKGWSEFLRLIEH